MKLSEAILLGSIGTGQCRIDLRSPLTGNTCALGAALTAIGFDFTYDEIAGYIRLEKEWPILTKMVTNPYNSEHQVDLMSVIWMLNDTHHWPRPRIAEYVASIEQELEKEQNGGLVEKEVQLR